MDRAISLDELSMLQGVAADSAATVRSPRPRRYLVDNGYNPVQAASIIGARQGLAISNPCAAIRITAPHSTARAMIVFYDHSLENDSAKVALTSDGMIWTRSVLRQIAGYALFELAIGKLWVMLRPSDWAGMDFARRLGFALKFRWEDGFADGGAGSIWCFEPWNNDRACRLIFQDRSGAPKTADADEAMTALVEALAPREPDALDRIAALFAPREAG